jgi:hypothetical protein
MVLAPASLMYVVGKWRVQVIGAKKSDSPLSCRYLADDLISPVGKGSDCHRIIVANRAVGELDGVSPTTLKATCFGEL